MSKPVLNPYAEGTTIPGTPYRVIQVLGAGGMGVVYEVEDTSVGKRYVVKTLHAAGDVEQDTKHVAQLLRAEARTLATLDHPNIVTVITAGQSADGQAYVVMEKLAGCTLGALLAELRSGLPFPFVWQIGRELCDALYYVHQPDEGRAAIIHRDIKPENIFLARNRDGTYTTKILDFGIASIFDGEKAGGFWGTLRWAAPEQIRGDALTPLTDLYALGCVLFTMLVGRHPFADAKGDGALVEAHLRRTPPKVSEFVRVPPRVDAIIDAALSKNPERRPAHAHKIMLALQDLERQSRPIVRDAANTTIEDLHTAIERHTEAGYELYATSPGGTFKGMTQPPMAEGTLEEEFPSFAVASTDLPHVLENKTVPMARAPRKSEPPREEKQPRKAEPAPDFREAPTRTYQEPPRGRPRTDTEPTPDSREVARARSQPSARESKPEASTSAPVVARQTRGSRRAGKSSIVIPMNRSSRQLGAIVVGALVGLAVIVGAARWMRNGARSEPTAPVAASTAAAVAPTSTTPSIVTPATSDFAHVPEGPKAAPIIGTPSSSGRIRDPIAPKIGAAKPAPVPPRTSSAPIPAASNKPEPAYLEPDRNF